MQDHATTFVWGKSRDAYTEFTEQNRKGRHRPRECSMMTRTTCLELFIGIGIKLMTSSGTTLTDLSRTWDSTSRLIKVALLVVLQQANCVIEIALLVRQTAKGTHGGVDRKLGAESLACVYYLVGK
ncbi:hypothetical protein IG631_08899 [Alternaria alternata]|jgi:hypothetical protein|nr:hypothetical protein IG631_08899 [Alternaria alternata]